MKPQKQRLVEHIINLIPAKYVKKTNRMNQRKLIKFIIDRYTEFIFDTLTKDEKFIILNVGSLEAVDFKIGEKPNPFTGNLVMARDSKRIKFTPSIKIRNKLKE